MLNRTVIEKKDLGQDPSLQEFIPSFSSFPSYQASDTLENMIQEYLLFEQDGSLVGCSYLEGAKDTKNCNAMLLHAKEETKKNVIEDTTTYALDNLGMLDVNWDVVASYDTFLKIAEKNHYEISPFDTEIVVISQSIQKELEQRKNR